MKRLVMTCVLLFAAISSGEGAMAKKIDKEALAEKIKSLAGLDAEERSELLGLLHEQKKYGLVWEDKPEDVEAAMREQLPVLAEVKERAIVGVQSAPNHILIEGDNLHALTCLTYTHSNKVDVIYIDPPYNTGNKDFVYNDNYVDKDDAFRHSKWLSFMDKRLRIAKGLLSDKGVIFISIDDNEQAQLKLLCDEIFGEENFIGCIARLIKAGGNKGDLLKPKKDYALIYAKNVAAIDKNSFGRNIVQQEYEWLLDEENDNKRQFALGEIPYRARLDSRPNQRYYIECPDGSFIIPPGDVFPNVAFDGAMVKQMSNRDKCWTWSQKRYLEEKKENRFYFYKARKPIFLNELGKPSLWGVRKKIFRDELEETEKREVLVDFLADFPNSLGTSELVDLQIDFSYPKPTALIEYFISIAGKDRSTILDFFAGSGTTLHAVMKLNAEDGGKRTCILVTNNENGICEKVTYERNRRVIQGYVNAKGEAVPGLQDNSLRYYKTEFVPRRPSPRNARALMAASVDLLCVKNDLYEEAPRFFGKKLKASAGRYFDDGSGKRMLVLFDETTVPSVAEAIRDTTFDGKVKIYVFSHGDYAYNEEFEEVADRVELCALPAAILNAYRRVIGKYRPQEDAQEEEAK